MADQTWALFADRTRQNLRYYFDVHGTADIMTAAGDMLRPEQLTVRINHAPGFAVPRTIEAVVQGPLIIDGEVSSLRHRIDVWDRSTGRPRPTWVALIVESHLPEGWSE
jgi:hypothetical protein